MIIKILSVVGARPQFIKAGILSRAIKKFDKLEEVIVHTGQHYNNYMSKIFFKELQIPKPKYFLGINQLRHGAMTGKMLKKIEEIILLEKPNLVVVFGDTNSTLAGALAARKLNIPIAHIESGLRSNNLNMPEEVNRILTDRISTILFCPSKNAIKNLKAESFPFYLNNKTKQKLFEVGDIMIDSMKYYKNFAKNHQILKLYNLNKKKYILCTLHRQENIDGDLKNLINIFNALQKISQEVPVVLPLHPRTKKKILQNKKLFKIDKIKIINPVSYIAMQCLQINAKLIITDSGGIQKEAYFHKVPCLTLRNETEWIETLQSKWNQLVDLDTTKILSAIKKIKVLPNNHKQYYGNGNAADKICKIIQKIILHSKS